MRERIGHGGHRAASLPCEHRIGSVRMVLGHFLRSHVGWRGLARGAEVHGHRTHSLGGDDVADEG